MRKILFFSGNEGKVKEVNSLIDKKKLHVLSLSNFRALEEPKESGTTFEENAKIKSKFGYEKLNLPCFADDSGICIDALNNKPGVNSKKFLESFNNKNECLEYIIKKSLEANKFKAYFKTSICFTSGINSFVFFEGIIRGSISKSICGTKGFGYDPIFVPNGYNKTFGQMSIFEKNKVSHRSLAMRKFLNFIIN